jgi:hypothetical protein
MVSARAGAAKITVSASKTALSAANGAETAILLGRQPDSPRHPGHDRQNWNITRASPLGKG